MIIDDTRKLAEIADRERRRARLYHIELGHALRWMNILYDLLYEECEHELPLGVASNHAFHIERIERALAADTAEIAALLAAAGERGE